MKLLRLIIGRSKPAIGMAVVAGLVSGLTTTLLIGAVNRSIQNGGAKSTAAIVAFASLCVVRLGSGVLAHFLLVQQSQRAVRDLRLDLCRHIINAPLAQIERLGAHRLAAAFGDDMLQIANVVVNLPYMFVNCIILVGCLVYLGWLSWIVFASISLCLALGALSYIVPVRWANNRLRQARKEQDELFRHFGSLVEGAKELKLHADRREEFLSEILGRSADVVSRHNTTGITVYSAAANWNRLLFFVYVGLLLFLLPMLMHTPPVVLAGYVLVVLYMMAPLEAVMNVIPLVAHADIAVRQIQDLGVSLSMSGGAPSDSGSPLVASSWQQLRFCHIKYGYTANTAADSFVLGPLSLTLWPGEVVFVVGGNGSGKTTLAKLLTGLYSPQSGRVLLDDQLILEANRDQYRQLFSAVFGDFHLFDRLVGFDVRLINSRVHEYLTVLGLDRKVLISSDGRFSTTALSQGQKKRLALLVALLEERPIYLFDEWTADQDVQFREVFYGAVLPDLRARGKTVVVITHDERYFGHADRIIRMEYGQLAHDLSDSADSDLTRTSAEVLP